MGFPKRNPEGYGIFHKENDIVKKSKVKESKEEKIYLSVYVWVWDFALGFSPLIMSGVTTSEMGWAVSGGRGKREHQPYTKINQNKNGTR